MLELKAAFLRGDVCEKISFLKIERWNNHGIGRVKCCAGVSEQKFHNSFFCPVSFSISFSRRFSRFSMLSTRACVGTMGFSGCLSSAMCCFSIFLVFLGSLSAPWAASYSLTHQPVR